MKRSIKRVYIDGLPKTGSTSVFKQLKPSNHSIYHGFLDRIFFNEMLNVPNLDIIVSKNIEQVRSKQNSNATEGEVCFFLVPENINIIKNRLDGDVSNMVRLIDFYKNINLYNCLQGLDIKIVIVQQHDRILDICAKIQDVIKKNYTINV